MTLAGLVAILAAVTGPMVSGVPDGVRKFRLLTPSWGWILKGEHLLASDLSGGQLSDITPPLSAGQGITAVFFLDPSRGWAVLNATNEESGLAEVSVSATTDGGRNWTSRPIRCTDKSLLEDGSGNTEIVFSDELHGWLAIQRVSSSAMTVGALFKTSDGGAAWTQLPDSPIFGNIGFSAGGFGWVKGGPLGDELYTTTDGGQRWHPRSTIQRPGHLQDAVDVYYGDPGFTSDGRGVLPVTLSLPDETAVLATYTSQDRGATWKLSGTESDLPPSIATCAVDGHVIRSIKRPQGIETGDVQSHSTARLPAGVPSSGSVGAIDFADENHGWMLFHGTECASKFVDCVDSAVLLATGDGAATLTVVATAKSRIYTPRAGRSGRQP